MADMRASTGYLRRLQQEANNELDRRYFAAVAAEIERLRAENEALRAENESWRSLDQIRLGLLRQSAAEVQRLQALIDAYAEASTEGDQYDHLRYMRTIGDLLAAATKEDDRG